MGINQKPMRGSVHSLGEVMGGASFRVPHYQRPYAWDAEHVQELWEDLTEPGMLGGDVGAYHFFGTLLTVDPEDSSSQGKRLEILDGQQRLATFTLLLVAIDRELEELNASDHASVQVRTNIAQTRKRIAEAIYQTDSRERRLELRPEEDVILANLLQGNPPHRGRLGDAFGTLHSAVRSFCEASQNVAGDLDHLVRVILDRSIVIHARCVYGFDPFAVFSTLNARGLPLSAAQVLRARSLGLVGGMGEAVKKGTEAAWDEIEKLDEEGTRFLQYYLVMKEGKRVQSKSVVRKFDRKILKESKGLEHASQAFAGLAAELSELVQLYRRLRKGSWPVDAPGVSAWKQRRLRLLIRELGVKQAMPLIMAIAHRTPESLVEAVEVIERAAFVALMCFPNQTKWGDRLFQNASKVFNGEMDLSALKADVRLFFTQQLGNPERRLAEALPIQLRYNGRKKTLLRYFLTTLNDYGYPAAVPQQPDQEVEWDLDKIQIEHISPRSLSDGVAPDGKDRLGNLTPLYGPSNASLGNTPFAQKKQRYLESPLRMTRELAGYESWTAAEIDRREKDMVRFAVALYCRDMKL